MTEQGCPALADLLAEPRPPEVERHLRGCPRCGALAAGSSEPLELSLDPSTLPRPEGIARPASPPAAEPGTIARFGAEATETALLALILSQTGPLLRVAPIVEGVGAATEWDLKLPAEILSYAAIVSVGEAREIRREQLLGTRVALPDDLWTWAQTLEDLREGGAAVPAEAPVGYPVLAEIDPRVRLARERADARRPFWSAAELLGAGESFGATVRRRREALALEPAELEELVERPGWFERLESDRLDLYGELPVPALAKLMGRLQIPPLGPVTEQLRTAIESHAEALTGPTRLARRRTSARPARVAAGPQERREIADRYLANLMAALEER